MAFKTKLKGLSKVWKGVREDSNAFPSLDPGTYIVFLTGEIMTSSAGNFGILWKYQVARKGEYAGFVQTGWSGLEEDPDRLIWLARMLARLEYEVEEMDIESLEDIVAEIAETPPLLSVRVVEKDGFTNVYINTVVDPDEYDDLIIPDFEHVSPNGESSTTTTTTGGDANDWAAMGIAADAEDDDAIDALTAKAAEADLSPDDYPTWVALAEIFTYEEGTEEGDAAASEDLVALGTAGDEGDEDSIATLTAKATEAGLDPDDYSEWADLVVVLLAATGKETGSESIDYDTLGAEAEAGDEGAQEKLTDWAGDAGLDPDEYSWEELAEALKTSEK